MCKSTGIPRRFLGAITDGGGQQRGYPAVRDEMTERLGGKVVFLAGVGRGGRDASARASATRVRAAAEASRLFFEAGRSRVALCRALARSLARSPGDACAIYTLGRDGLNPRAAALAHADSGARRLLLQILRAAPNALLDAFSLRALQSGNPVRVPVISPKLLSLWSQPEFGAYAERFIASSILVVPLRASGRRLGVLRVWRERPHGVFAPDAEEFILELVERLALT